MDSDDWNHFVFELVRRPEADWSLLDNLELPSHSNENSEKLERYRRNRSTFMDKAGSIMNNNAFIFIEMFIILWYLLTNKKTFKKFIDSSKDRWSKSQEGWLTLTEFHKVEFHKIQRLLRGIMNNKTDRVKVSKDR